MNINEINATQIVGLDEKLKTNKKLTVKLGFINLSGKVTILLFLSF